MNVADSPLLIRWLQLFSLWLFAVQVSWSSPIVSFGILSLAHVFRRITWCRLVYPDCVRHLKNKWSVVFNISFRSNVSGMGRCVTGTKTQRPRPAHNPIGGTLRRNERGCWETRYSFSQQRLRHGTLRNRNKNATSPASAQRHRRDVAEKQTPICGYSGSSFQWLPVALKILYKTFFSCWSCC